jgi:hypothetical protein
MHGGWKFYRGSPIEARQQLEALRRWTDVDDVSGGTAGLAERYVASPEGVQAVGTLTGESYEAWVAGYDPASGAAKGSLRTGDRALRFAELAVNGPKTWSLAAVLYSDVARAYDAALRAAAEQITGWLGGHATTRVGRRGGQVQVPVEELEAVVVRRYASRAGDPHRHLGLQVNVRVFAQGKWRGLHTVGLCEDLTAINGIGHAAILTAPGFRAALAGHGLTVDLNSGELVELAEFVDGFSARAAQIRQNLSRYEKEWSDSHPGEEPGRGLWRAWRARAWASGRPRRAVTNAGREHAAGWAGQLRGLGYRDPEPPFCALPVAVGVHAREFDRDAAVPRIVVGLAGRWSRWNAADVRGEAELVVARAGIIAEAAVRIELTEDLTARVLETSDPILRGVGARGDLRYRRRWGTRAPAE